MIPIALLSAYLLFLTLDTAIARGGPVRMTERGSAVLVWLENHPKPGTPHSRAVVRNRFRALVWRGLRVAGVAWLDARTGDVDPSSPFGCIHQHEGPWKIHNPPYDGGLQEDHGFQATYGREYRHLWGSAGHWPIWSQVVSGYRAYHGYHGYGARGFYPWPNTARYCGLLP
jgi:hypothetical protein